MPPETIKEYSQYRMFYDAEKRGSSVPDYSAAEVYYRNNILNGLQMSYMIREQTHMELDDKTYSEYYLINRQQDFAYNPPKRNAADTRIVSGTIHEKDNTIQQLIVDMNFQPRVRVYDEDDNLLEDASHVFTAKLKKSLIQDNFNQDKLPEFIRLNISQGNVFIREMRNKHTVVKKVPTQKSPTGDPTKMKWKMLTEEVDLGCTSIALPNTAMFFSNIIERNIHKQPRIWYVIHLPIQTLESMFGNFPRWKNVPKFPTRTVPVNTDGIWGDYYLQQPQQNYGELIVTESELENDYNCLVNGVLMYPVLEENGVISGYPLTEISPSGLYDVVKGDNEPIPFFTYGRSVPSKNEVKEETKNELLRLMVYMTRQKAKPPVGNNSDKILQSNIWDPATITPDIRKEDISILTPNAGITQADFSFYDLISKSIDDGSVSAALEGSGSDAGTATQYVGQKKEDLKKLGISFDGTVSFLREIYWLRLYNEIEYIDKPQKRYDPDEDKFIEALSDFSAEGIVDGQPGKVTVKLVGDNIGRTPEDVMAEEEELSGNERLFYARPDYLKKVMKNLRNKIYIDVVAEPEGQNQSLLAILFNILTQYSNLRGGPIPNLNYDYIDKIIGQNSGFEADKLFLTKEQMAPPVPMLGPDGQPMPDASGMGGMAEAIAGGAQGKVKPMNIVNNQQNSTLANAA